MQPRQELHAEIPAAPSTGAAGNRWQQPQGTARGSREGAEPLHCKYHNLMIRVTTRLHHTHTPERRTVQCVKMGITRHVSQTQSTVQACFHRYSQVQKQANLAIVVVVIQRSKPNLQVLFHVSEILRMRSLGGIGAATTPL
jgi:hypothetical protein